MVSTTNVFLEITFDTKSVSKPQPTSVNVNCKMKFETSEDPFVLLRRASSFIDETPFPDAMKILHQVGFDKYLHNAFPVANSLLKLQILAFSLRLEKYETLALDDPLWKQFEFIPYRSIIQNTSDEMREVKIYGGLLVAIILSMRLQGGFEDVDSKVVDFLVDVSHLILEEIEMRPARMNIISVFVIMASQGLSVAMHHDGLLDLMSLLCQQLYILGPGMRVSQVAIGFFGHCMNQTNFEAHRMFETLSIEFEDGTVFGGETRWSYVSRGFYVCKITQRMFCLFMFGIIKQDPQLFYRMDLSNTNLVTLRDFVLDNKTTENGVFGFLLLSSFLQKKIKLVAELCTNDFLVYQFSFLHSDRYRLRQWALLNFSMLIELRCNLADKVFVKSILSIDKDDCYPRDAMLSIVNSLSVIARCCKRFSAKVISKIEEIAKFSPDFKNWTELRNIYEASTSDGKKRHEIP